VAQPIMPGLGLIGTILGVLVFPLALWVWRIWKNDLKHVGDRLDKIEDGQGRIETKLDDHINSHAKGDFKE